VPGKYGNPPGTNESGLTRLPILKGSNVSLIQLIGLLIVVGIIMALVPMEAHIKRWVLILIAVVAAFVLLRAIGLWPF
jgi:4-hydroxybenzoate polyprenyltransferase